MSFESSPNIKLKLLIKKRTKLKCPILKSIKFPFPTPNQHIAKHRISNVVSKLNKKLSRTRVADQPQDLFEAGWLFL